MQTAVDKSEVTSQAPQVTLVLYIFKLVLYFNTSIVRNQIKYYLERIFYRYSMAFTGMLCGFAISYDGLLLKIACTKNSRKLMSSWKYHGKRSLFYHCKKFFMKVCFFLTGGAVTRFAIWLAGSIYWNRFVFHSDSWNRSLIINDIINVCRYF